MLAYKLKESLKTDASSVNSLHGGEGQNWYNIATYNPDLTNMLSNVVAVLSFLTYLLITVKDWEDEIIVPNMLGFMIPMFFMLFLLPLRTCLKNPDIWSHVKVTYFMNVFQN